MYNISLINNLSTNQTPSSTNPQNLLAPLTSKTAIENIQFVNYAASVTGPKRTRNPLESWIENDSIKKRKKLLTGDTEYQQELGGIELTPTDLGVNIENLNGNSNNVNKAVVGITVNKNNTKKTEEFSKKNLRKLSKTK